MARIALVLSIVALLGATPLGEAAGRSSYLAAPWTPHSSATEP